MEAVRRALDRHFDPTSKTEIKDITIISSSEEFEEYLNKIEGDNKKYGVINESHIKDHTEGAEHRRKENHDGTGNSTGSSLIPDITRQIANLSFPDEEPSTGEKAKGEANEGDVSVAIQLDQDGNPQIVGIITISRGLGSATDGSWLNEKKCDAQGCDRERNPMMFCKDCLLVMYCSENCRTQSRKAHRVDLCLDAKKRHPFHGVKLDSFRCQGKLCYSEGTITHFGPGDKDQENLHTMHEVFVEDEKKIDTEKATAESKEPRSKPEGPRGKEARANAKKAMMDKTQDQEDNKGVGAETGDTINEDTKANAKEDAPSDDQSEITGEYKKIWIWNEHLVEDMMEGEKKTDDWGGKNLHVWGRTKARDLLDLENNEGKDYQKDLSVCLTEAEDIRSVISTVNNLPNKYKGRVSMVINQEQFYNQCRNILMTLLPLLHPNGDASELIVHIWYSSRLPSRAWKPVKTRVVPLIEEVWKSIENEKENTAGFTKSWKFGRSEVKVTFSKKAWFNFLWVVRRKLPLDMEEAEESRQNAMVSYVHRREVRTDYRIGTELNELLQLSWEQHQATEYFYRVHGVLVPYAKSLTLESYRKPRKELTKTFDVANPTMFNIRGEWLIDTLARPSDGWDLVDLHRQHSLGKSKYPHRDLHSIIFFETRNSLKLFSQRCASTSVSFNFFHAPALDLPNHMACNPAYADANGIKQLFDRIDITEMNVSQAHQLDQKTSLIKALNVYEPLLKRDNPHAIISNLFCTEINNFRKAMVEAADIILDSFEDNKRAEAGVHILERMLFNRNLFERFADTEGMKAAAKVFFTEEQQAKNKADRTRLVAEIAEQDDLLWRFLRQSLKLDSASEKVGLAVKKDEKPFWLKTNDNKEVNPESFLLRFAGNLNGSEHLVTWGHSTAAKGSQGDGK